MFKMHIVPSTGFFIALALKCIETGDILFYSSFLIPFFERFYAKISANEIISVDHTHVMLT